MRTAHDTDLDIVARYVQPYVEGLENRVWIDRNLRWGGKFGEGNSMISRDWGGYSYIRDRRNVKGRKKIR